ncbi:MAG TPA: DUF1801 domain-containing protein [Gemmatimonadaceae bacterium]|nr:DUF1801 domain-containing protein [Gemmatimonadaceae bacterium]
MAARKTTKKVAKKSAPGGADGRSEAKGFSAEERAAMRERAKELASARSGGDAANEESAVLAKIAEMSLVDRAMASRVHSLIKAAAPDLAPRLWYGMPAWAKDGRVVCFFQSGAKFKARYCTIAFSDRAALDDGDMWPTSYALTKIGAAEEQRIRELVLQAVR